MAEGFRNSIRPPFLADEEIFRERVVALFADGAVPSFEVGEENASLPFMSDSGSSNGVGFENCPLLP